MSTIHDACRSGDIKLVRELIAANPVLVDADDEYEWRPIFHAALRKQTEVVDCLLENGADIAAHDGYVLHYAAEVPGNQEIVTRLVQFGALEAHVRPVNDRSRQLLSAIFLNDHQRVDALLRLHPDLAAQVDGIGDEPMHHAARNGATEVVRMLIDYGASVNAANTRGHTVLYCAAGHGHADTVELLLAHGVDVTVKFTDDGKTVAEWLDQYPDEPSLAKVRSMLP